MSLMSFVLCLVSIIGTGQPQTPYRLDVPVIWGSAYPRDQAVHPFGWALVSLSDVPTVETTYPGACTPQGAPETPIGTDGQRQFTKRLDRYQALGLSTTGLSSVTTLESFVMAASRQIGASLPSMRHLWPLAQQPARPPHTILTSDTFPASDLSADWVKDLGTWDTVGDELRGTNSADNNRVRNTVVSQANYFVGVKARQDLSTTEGTRLLGRMKSDASANFYFMVQSTAVNGYTLHRRVAGADTLLIGPVAPQGVINDRMILEFATDDKRIYVNGVQVGGTATETVGEASGQGGVQWPNASETAPSAVADNFVIATTLSEADDFITTGTLFQPRPSAVLGNPSLF